MRGGSVKVVGENETGDQEKDVDSEIAAATFAELVLVTSACAGVAYATPRRDYNYLV